MSLKYSNTTADYLVWSDAMNLIRKLAKDDNYKMSLLVALGCFTGLRISDILALRWFHIHHPILRDALYTPSCPCTSTCVSRGKTTYKYVNLRKTT